jgi:uncharacterized protein YqeY
LDSNSKKLDKEQVRQQCSEYLKKSNIENELIKAKIFYKEDENRLLLVHESETSTVLDKMIKQIKEQLKSFTLK